MLQNLEVPEKAYIAILDQFWIEAEDRKIKGEWLSLQESISFLDENKWSLKQRLTRCSCSKVKSKKSNFPDIRALLLKEPSEDINVTEVFDHKYSGINMSRTSADIIRGDHDRKKKRKR